MTSAPSTSKWQPKKRKVQRQRDEQDGSAAEQILTNTEMLLSAGLWTIILAAICWYWIGFSSGSMAEPAIGENIGASDKTIAKSVIKQRTNTAACWSGPLPSTVKQLDKPGPVDFDRSFATITLYAGCPFKTYVEHADRFWYFGHWHYVKTSSIKKIVVQHHGQDPISLHEVWEDDVSLGAAISATMRPKAMLFTEFVSFLYSGSKRPFVILMPEPTLDVVEVDSKYRGLLMHVYERFADKWQFSYMLPDMHKEWVESEFGVQNFPSIVVHEEEFPGHSVVYSGDMSNDSVVLFLRDVLAGCADYKPGRTAPFFRKSDQLVCNAAPVLRGP